MVRLFSKMSSEVWAMTTCSEITDLVSGSKSRSFNSKCFSIIKYQFFAFLASDRKFMYNFL